MFLTGKDRQGKEEMAAGIDLGDRFVQISLFAPGADRPATRGGGEDSLIPALLAWRRDRRLWLAGQDAVKCVAAGNGIPVSHLLSGALEQKTCRVDGEEYEYVTLLALFLNRCLSWLGEEADAVKAGQLMFSLDSVDKRTIALMDRLAGLLSVPREKISVQSRSESFFYYSLNQPKELWQHACMVCDFGGKQMKVLMMEPGQGEAPVPVTVSEEDCPSLTREEDMHRLDHVFARLMEEMCRGKTVDTVYLLGDGFDSSWYTRSLQVLCSGRRVFRGSNLYSKGACYACRGVRTVKGKAGREPAYAFVGSDMLRAGVGLESIQGSVACYHPLLEAGTNWYDAFAECDFLLNEDLSFSLRVTPMLGRDIKEVVVTLDHVPQRPERTTRIHLTVSCPDADTVLLRMEDRGFGELFPGSGRIWEERFVLDEGGRKGGIGR